MMNNNNMNNYDYSNKNLDITAPLQPLTHEDFFQSKNSDRSHTLRHIDFDAQQADEDEELTQL
jgi:hypothetical protein